MYISYKSILLILVYNWLYFIINYWLRKWKANSTKVSSELFSNASLAFTIVPLLGSFFNRNFFSAFFKTFFSMDILTCMNFVNWFCLHFENISNISFWTETTLIGLSVFWKICSLYFFISRNNLSRRPPLIGWYHLLPYVYLVTLFHFILYFLLSC